METKNIKYLTLIVTFFVGLVTLLLSLFEEGIVALMYQMVSIVLLSVSVILFYLCFIMDTEEKVKIVSVSKPKEKIEKSNYYDKEKEEPKIIVEKIEKKEKDEDFFKKNIVSIDLEEDEDELNSDEKKVIKALKKNEGSMQQKDVTDSVFKKNKVKAHRVLSSLIEKDFVIKRKEGKTNKIFLK